MSADANRNSEELDYNIDREEIAMEEANPFTVPLVDTDSDQTVKQEYLDQMSFYADSEIGVIDIPSPDGLEDAPELPAMGPGMEDDEEDYPSLDDLFSALNRMFAPRESSVQVKALEVLMPLLDAGVDAMAMEGAIKSPDELGTLEGQMAIRGELVDGAIEALQVFGVDRGDVFTAMKNVEVSGFRFKQGPDDIADRLTVIDRVSMVNYLYGPKMAGRILISLEDKDLEGDNG